MADEDPAPGVPEWVVTYGDMMSLLLTFFIMLVSLSEVVADEKYRAILDSLMQYTGYRTAPVAPPGQSFPLNSLIEKLDTLGAFTEHKLKGGVKTEALPGEDVRVKRLPEGQSILVEEPVLFVPESARYAVGQRQRLDHIAIEIAGKPNKVEVRGRVAPSLRATMTYGEMLRLSYDRAKLVSDDLATSGISTSRIRITAEGAASTVPLGEENNAAFEDSVSVYLLDELTATYVGPRDRHD